MIVIIFIIIIIIIINLLIIGLRGRLPSDPQSGAGAREASRACGLAQGAIIVSHVITLYSLLICYSVYIPRYKYSML